VITANVPPDALAVARSRQVVREGWATRLRALKSLGKRKEHARD
jgi:bifunctional UDP-N-acetylglucosamine pyrophosphorylase/glucosamine-1-phosphate N-acetyltransferase